MDDEKLSDLNMNDEMDDIVLEMTFDKHKTSSKIPSILRHRSMPINIDDIKTLHEQLNDTMNSNDDDNTEQTIINNNNSVHNLIDFDNENSIQIFDDLKSIYNNIKSGNNNNLRYNDIIDGFIQWIDMYGLNKIKDYKDKINERDTKILELQHKIDVLTQTNNELNNELNTNDSKPNKLSDNDSQNCYDELNDLRIDEQQFEFLKSRNISLQKDNENLEEQIRNLSNQIIEWQKEALKWKTIYTDKSKDLEQQNIDVKLFDRIINENKNFKAQYRELKSNYDNLAIKFNEISNNNLTYQKLNSNLKYKYNNINDKYLDLKNKYETILNIKNDLSNELNKIKRDNKDMETKNIELKRHNILLINRNSDLSENLKEANNSNNNNNNNINGELDRETVCVNSELNFNPDSSTTNNNNSINSNTPNNSDNKYRESNTKNGYNYKHYYLRAFTVVTVCCVVSYIVYETFTQNKIDVLRDNKNHRRRHHQKIRDSRQKLIPRSQ